MTLIKSKINSLAWLKSAIYVSIVGGVFLSSTPILAATFDYEDEREVALTVKRNSFGNGVSTLFYPGKYWKGTINIDEFNGPVGDSLVIRVYLQHIHNLHQGDSAVGGQLNLNFRSESSSASAFEFDDDVSEHPGIKHFDKAGGMLTVNKFNYLITTGIKDWELKVDAEHNVPEPTTMLAAALAVGWGGWMKHKNSIKQNKTKSQG